MSGPQCCENPPTLNPSSGSGHVEKFGGLDAYVSGSPDSKLGVLLVSDIFGRLRTRLQLLDSLLWFLTTSMEILMIPLIRRDPSMSGLKTMAMSVLPPYQLLLSNLVHMFNSDKGFEDTKPVLEAIKNKGITAVGAAGMCWGAKVVVELSKQELIQAAVLLHPTFVVVDDIKNVKTPIAILGAEIDFLSPPALIKQFEEILACKPEVNSYVKIYPKVSHGWTIRYSLDEPEAVKAAEEAHREMLDWFMTYVK